MLSKKFTAVAGASEPTDAQFNYVTMLLRGDGTNGAQNNTFLDSGTANSGSGFTVTTNGTTAQGSFSPYGSEWSGYFSGASYVYTAASSDYDISGVDFTIEFWINWTKGNTMLYAGMSVATNFQNSVGWAVTCDSYGTDNLVSLNFQTYDGGWSYATNTSINATTMPKGVWHHIAIVRSGSGAGNLKFFLNGTNVGGTYNAPTYTGSGGNLAFGIYQQNYTYAGNPDMNISNFRLVKGTALYSSNFTPSTTPLTAVTNTKYLGFQSNRFVNNGTTGGTQNIYGSSMAVQRFSPFSPTNAYTTATVGGSVYYIAGYPYLSVANNAAFNFGTGDFTLEFWAYVTPSVGNGSRFISNALYNSSGIDISYDVSAGGWNWYVSGTSYRTATLPELNSWHHVAWSRSGTTLRVYLDGVLSNTYTGMSSNITSSNALAIGAYNGGGSYTLDYGYMSDVRLIKGTALYTGSTLTLPTAPLTAVSGTSLLLNTNNAGIYDSAMMNDFQTVGNAQISTSVKKYGTGSIYFDGSGDQLVAANNSVFNFGFADFTVECWLYATASNCDIVNYSNGQSSNSNFAWELYLSSSTTISFSIFEGATQYTATSTAFTMNAWNHVAAVRNNNTIKIYVNGVVGGTTVGVTATSPNNPSGATLKLSGYNNGSSVYTGYIDDIRISKGLARYTANFTPPTAALPDK